METHNTGVLSAMTGMCYLMSFTDLDTLILTPAMHLTTILVGIATLYFYTKPQKKTPNK